MKNIEANTEQNIEILVDRISVMEESCLKLSSKFDKFDTFFDSYARDQKQINDDLVSINDDVSILKSEINKFENVDCPSCPVVPCDGQIARRSDSSFRPSNMEERISSCEFVLDQLCVQSDAQQQYSRGTILQFEEMLFY